MKSQFGVTSREFAQKNKAGAQMFVNRVAWVFAHLNMEAGPLGHPKAATLVREGVYRITKRGMPFSKVTLSNSQSRTFECCKREIAEVGSQRS